MSIESIKDIEQLRKLAYILCDAIDVLHKIVLKMEGDPPSDLVEKLVKLADKSERIKNAN